MSYIVIHHPNDDDEYIRYFKTFEEAQEECADGIIFNKSNPILAKVLVGGEAK